MITLLVGTDRPNSRSSEVAHYIEQFYQDAGQQTRVLQLSDVGLDELRPEHYSDAKPAKMVQAVDTLLQDDGLVVICPEYNGSMPGALKHFIDHWRYPESFEHRPVAFIGLGGRFGGLRPVEHLQQIFGYRNAFIYPDRIFLQNVWGIVQEGKITDEKITELLQGQAQGFCRFIKALKSEKLHAGETQS